MSSSLPVLSPQPVPREPPETPFRAHLAVWQRLLLMVAGGGLLSLLVVAACLSPNPQGLGTHRQLGLPPCTMVQLFELRCPACGMTTSWSLFVRGRWPTALATNSGGTLLALAAAISAPWMLFAAAAGRFWCAPPTQEWLVVGTLTIAAVTVIDWSVRSLPVILERWYGN